MKPEISVVIPFYNEAENIDPVCSELLSVLMSGFVKSWEVVLIDDGSTDGTAAAIDRWANKSSFRAVHLCKNSGQSAALFAGFAAAQGDCIFTLDGDGQNDPADIPRLLKKMKELNVGMICGVRVKRNDSKLRRFSSRLANRIRAKILGDCISDVGCSSRGFKKECLDSFRFFRNAHRFFPALVQMGGYKVAEMPVNHRARNKGVSKYGLGLNSRIWVGIADLFGVYWMKKRYISVSSYEYMKNHTVAKASGE